MPIRPDTILCLEHGVEPSQCGSVLVVDDEPDIRILICRVLRERGFSIVEAGDGEEALALIARVSHFGSSLAIFECLACQA